MNVDSGAVASYLGILGTAFFSLAVMLYRIGKLASTFESHVAKMQAWEHAMSNLNSIPDLKRSIELLNEKIARHEEFTSRRFERHQDDLSEVRSNLALFQGRLAPLASHLAMEKK